MNESVWLPYRAPGAALPGRKVMTLVHGMLAGADSIDDMNVLRAGSTGLVLGHRVMAPSTLGTFLRAFTFGHVRQLDRVLDVALARAWEAGAGPGELPLVIDLDSFVGEVHGKQKEGASYGYTKQLGYHPILAVRSDTGELLHIRNRQGKANTQRGARRFVDELLARVRRAGHGGLIILRADTGFENYQLMGDAGPPRSRVLDRGQAEQEDPRADRPDPRHRLGHRERLSRQRRGTNRRDEARRLATDRAPHPPARRPSRTISGLAALRVRDQSQRADAHARHRSPRRRSDRARDPRPHRAGDGAFPFRQIRPNSAWTVIAALAHNLGRWLTGLALPNQPVQAAHSRRRRLLAIPARLTRTSRRWILRMPARWPWQNDFTTILDAIRALPARA